jgi:hypothetical protein
MAEVAGSIVTPDDLDSVPLSMSLCATETTSVTGPSNVAPSGTVTDPVIGPPSPVPVAGVPWPTIPASQAAFSSTPEIENVITSPGPSEPAGPPSAAVTPVGEMLTLMHACAALAPIAKKSAAATPTRRAGDRTVGSRMAVWP